MMTQPVVWLKTLREEGFEALVTWQPGQGAPAQVSKEVQGLISEGLTQGRWRRARDVQRDRLLQQGRRLQPGF